MVFRAWSEINRDRTCNKFIIVVIPDDLIIPEGIMKSKINANQPIDYNALAAQKTTESKKKTARKYPTVLKFK